MRLEKLEDVNWKNWRAVDDACLLFVVKNGNILLIHKKRGLGAGKINGPGGRLEPYEKPRDCAVREVQEELLITPTGLSQRGVLRFQFVDGYSIHCHVFTASGYKGKPQETEEAKPLWTPVDRIPFEKMWEDDKLWFPLMLAGKCFEGNFLFDGDDMLDYRLSETSEDRLLYGVNGKI